MADIFDEIFKDLGIEQEDNKKSKEEDLLLAINKETQTDKNHKKVVKRLTNTRIKNELLGLDTSKEVKTLQRLHNEKFYRKQLDLGRVKPTFYIDNKLNNLLNKEVKKLKTNKSDFLEQLLCKHFNINYDELKEKRK